MAEEKKDSTEVSKDRPPFMQNMDLLLEAFESKTTPHGPRNMRHWYFDLVYMIFGEESCEVGVGSDHPKLQFFYDKCLTALDALDIERPKLLPHGPSVKSDPPESAREREDVAAATAESVLEATSLLYREKQHAKTVQPKLIANDTFLLKLEFPGAHESQFVQYPLPKCSELMQAVREFNDTKSEQVARLIKLSLFKMPHRDCSTVCPTIQSALRLDMDELYDLAKKA
jgi:hypothetical protein